MVHIDPRELSADANYKLLIGSVLPRPIAWVSTLSADGIANLAPISFFTVVGRKPPRVSLTMQPRSDGATAKDSYRNIQETGEFVVHMATFPQALQVHRSAIEYPTEVDEFEVLGLEKESSAVVKPPRIRDAPIAMECVVHRIFPASDIGGVVWGEIVRYYFRDDVHLPNGRVDTGALAVIGRLAAEYTVVENAFVPPVPPDAFPEPQTRVRRLDGQGSRHSPIDTASWSPSGSTRAEDPAAVDGRGLD